MIVLYLIGNLSLLRYIFELNAHLTVINPNAALTSVTQRNTLWIEIQPFFACVEEHRAILFHKYNMMVFMGEVKNNLSSGGGM